jgi:hypothetical protein
MKKYILFAQLVVAFSAISQTKSDTLRNETIIKLTQSKIADNLIISKINTSPIKFDVSTDGLINLKKNSVSDAVINLMVEKQSKNDQAKSLSANNNSDGNNFTFKKSGIYFLKEKKYTPLDPTLVTSSNSKGGVLSSIYFGNKIMSQIEGNEANYTLNKETEIYFNFIPMEKDLNSSHGQSVNDEDYFGSIMRSWQGNSVAISPNEFKLVKLKVQKSILPFIKKNKREYQSGKIKGMKSDLSIGDNYIVNFKYEKVSEYTFKVKLPNDIQPGQYCFVYLGNNGKNMTYINNTNKVFDFGVE